MEITPDNKLRKLIVIGDKVLIKPDAPTDRTKSGLYLPEGVGDKEAVASGTVVKAGPGYALPDTDSYDEVWKQHDDKVKYMPLQVQEGDTAIYMQKYAVEVRYNDEKFVIMPQQAILMLIRDEDL
jgi:co-chaperonin GroES (HSP10)